MNCGFWTKTGISQTFYCMCIQEQWVKEKKKKKEEHMEFIFLIDYLLYRSSCNCFYN